MNFVSYSRYLAVTYRRGKPLAAYLYLPRKEGDVSVRTESRNAGLVIDYAADGRAIGIEITSPGKLTIAALNEALAAANQGPATAEELAPLAAA
jgi:uncharacterized protein YuzE